ncbi:MAG: hypothetical protein SOV57_00525 [Bacilli bacterium]|nr:hypothetical protein [Bacilli bacterium]
MINNIVLFLAENSDKMSTISKRTLIVLGFIIIVFFLAIGYLVKLIKYILKIQGDYVNETMYQVLEAKLVKDSKTFRKHSFRKNRVKFYFEARIPMLAIICSCILVFFYTLCINNLSWSFIGRITSDMFPVYSWPMGDFFGLHIPIEWPVLVKKSTWHFSSLEGWITYIFDIAIVYGIIHFAVCNCALLSRNIRTITEGNKFFKKDIEALKARQEAQQANQPPVPEPTDELQEYLSKK